MGQPTSFEEVFKTAFNVEFKWAECPKHGEYKSYHLPSGNWSTCLACLDEQKDRDAGRIPESELNAQARKQELLALGLPSRLHVHSLANFHPENDKANIILKTCLRYVETADERIKSGDSFLFFGNPGTGKTHLASAVLQAVHDQGFSCLYSTADKIMDEIKACWDRGGQDSEVIAKFSDVDFLVIDELGAGYGTQAERTNVFKIINRRYNNLRSTFGLSNLGQKDLTEVLSLSTFDRFQEGKGGVFYFDWKTHRGAK